MKTATLISLLLTTSAFPSSAHFIWDDLNYAECQVAVQNGSKGLVGLVNQTGIPVSNFSQVDGILYPQCISYCGNGWQSNGFTNTSAAVTTWLFPWLVLVAQLPFQTSGLGSDVLAAWLTMGSPIVAMYSLLITLSNSRWIYRKCTEQSEGNIADCYGDRKHMSRVAFILSQCQQVPLFIQDWKLLACAVALEKNKGWWEDLAARLRLSARTFPESLWPQMLIVIITYVLTLAYSFQFEIGGHPYLPGCS
jgi:hypothetical protein